MARGRGNIAKKNPQKPPTRVFRHWVITASPVSQHKFVNRIVPCEDGGSKVYKQCLHQDHEGIQFTPVAYKGKHRSGDTSQPDSWKFCGAQALRLSRIPVDLMRSPIREIRGDGPLDLTLAVHEDVANSQSILTSFRFQDSFAPPGSVTVTYNGGPTRQPSTQTKEFVSRVLAPALFDYTEHTVKITHGEMVNPFAPTKLITYHNREIDQAEATRENENDSVLVCHCGRIPRPYVTYIRGDQSAYYVNFTLEYGVVASFRELLFVVIVEAAMTGSFPDVTEIEVVYWSDGASTRLSFKVNAPLDEGDAIEPQWESSARESCDSMNTCPTSEEQVELSDIGDE